MRALMGLMAGLAYVVGIVLFFAKLGPYILLLGSAVLSAAVLVNYLVALGAIVALTGAVPVEAAERAIAARRPGGSLERALAAFRAGLALGSS